MHKATKSSGNPVSRRWYSRLALALWRPSLENVEPDIYPGLVDQLYRPVKALLMGAISFSLILIAIAIETETYGLIIYAAVIYCPANFLRILQLQWYCQLPPMQAKREAPALEAIYAVSTISICILIQIPTVYIYLHGSTLAKASVAFYSLTVATGLTSRNAGMPRLVLAQSLVMLIPFAIAQLMAVTPITLVNALSVVLLILSIHRMSGALQKDAASARQRAAENERIATTDALTGLLNRQGMHMKVPQLAQMHAAGLNLLYVDLDGLRSLNDIHGHAIGDELLKVVAKRLSFSVTAIPNALASRQGDDDFLIAAPGPPSEGAKLVKNLVDDLKTPVIIEGRTIQTSACIGIAHRRDGAGAVEQIRNVDCALQAAKGLGRGRFAIFTPAMANFHQEQALFEKQLRLAIAEDQITVVFQPIVDLSNGSIGCYESLARWTDLKLGQVPPSRFVAAAEELGLVDQLTENILIRACKQAAVWTIPSKVAVNVSAVQFNDASRLLASICKALDLSGLPGERLELEITEGVMLADTDTVSDIISRCRKLGVGIALDDFGSGYCSLAYLNRIPFEKVKIERSLTLAACGKSLQAQIIVKMVCELAKTLPAAVVTEGIETAEQAALMSRLGVRYAQGYLFGKPGLVDPQRAAVTELV